MKRSPAVNQELYGLADRSRAVPTRYAAQPQGVCSLEAFTVATDRRHVRRELSAAELDYLLDFVETYTTENHNLSGADRTIAYRVALALAFGPVSYAA